MLLNSVSVFRSLSIIFALSTLAVAEFQWVTESGINVFDIYNHNCEFCGHGLQFPTINTKRKCTFDIVCNCAAHMKTCGDTFTPDKPFCANPECVSSSMAQCHKWHPITCEEAGHRRPDYLGPPPSPDPDEQMQPYTGWADPQPAQENRMMGYARRQAATQGNSIAKVGRKILSFFNAQN
ncbi:uncharacterized protein MELLADRAFT_107091 [Melampsora larici-populina 98AG31]|uniref:Secreted protein n=1 Tax=Melampsora larici-populina (strain 98AG31 / pathotype 3-4-7) TaxID=747676 RepID=F4RNM7_MELLP|nr:uncharacterized protein MELLADRAFT_107091 [Melampsora larici-populina 98AG31]EGG06009.1 secreted protein [Melampsora larici-populina 98AG31]